MENDRFAEYVQNRLLPGLVRRACQEQGVQCEAFSDDWAFRLQKNGRTRWIVGYTFDANRAAVGLLSRDKVMTHIVLESAGIPSVPHYLLRTIGGETRMRAVLNRAFTQSDSVLIKPLLGTGGCGIGRVRSFDETRAHMDTFTFEAWAVSPYLPLIREQRLIICNEELLLAYDKTQPHDRGGVRYFNLSAGSRAVTIPNQDVPVELRSLAIASCRALNLHLAAIDIVTLQSGEQLVLETNNAISLEHFGRQSAEYVEIARLVYSQIINNLFMV